ncbi:hypothetical protein ACIA8E_34480 [Streptomyces sp. NPDC051664]|uniref:hypothetical protein n=1 Tax=Streptomyces sp. NPDC051664 TaxID=3365668 RepID=UPI0037A609D0
MVPTSRWARGSAGGRAGHDEAGADIAPRFRKPLNDEVIQTADNAIAIGCGDASPVGPGRCHLDWPVADPQGAPIAVVLRIRDEIGNHITDVFDSLPSA